MELKIYFRNADCRSERVQEIEKALSQRVVEISGGINEARAYWDAPDRLTNPHSHFNRYFNAAVHDVFECFGYSPAARRDAKFAAVWLGPDGKAF